jgi:hypothetical protein
MPFRKPKQKTSYTPSLYGIFRKVKAKKGSKKKSKKKI